MSDPKDTADCDQRGDNRSWLEICDEELDGDIKDEPEDSELDGIKDEPLSPIKYEVKSELSLSIKNEVKDEPLASADSESGDESSLPVDYKPNIANSTIEEGEIRSDLDDSIVKTEKPNDEGFASSAAISNILSYAKVLSRGSGSENVPKRKPASDIPTEDLSLTSHLDVFHVDSPCKEVIRDEAEIELMIDEDTIMFSPVKKMENPAKNMKRSFHLIESPIQNRRERTNSVHSTHKVSKSDQCSDVHSSKTGSSSTKSDSPSSKREVERNPDILARRQKQIDYGKNTLGYQNYCQRVPKFKRTKDDPKTPPKHLKLSRRAWDGLVKNWRVKLHKYDSEDCDKDSINSDPYSLSSEMSSNYDSSSIQSDSTPSTPSQVNSQKKNGPENYPWNGKSHKAEKTKELWPDCPQKSDKSDDEEYLGCESLNENCVEACS
ncbi:enolase-phosphatase E1 [Planococcus citri]|uniref:enolase-phosphatase E1 n=1 Tax=Planococcus citri TaxID=170843 RepID=UPI0031F8467F